MSVFTTLKVFSSNNAIRWNESFAIVSIKVLESKTSVVKLGNSCAAQIQLNNIIFCQIDVSKLAVFFFASTKLIEVAIGRQTLTTLTLSVWRIGFPSIDQIAFYFSRQTLYRNSDANGRVVECSIGCLCVVVNQSKYMIIIIIK